MHKIECAHSALNFLDPACPREKWVRIGMAAKSAELTFEAFHSWSEGGHNYVSEDDCKNTWDSFKADGPITVGTLYKLATDEGWQRPNDYLAEHISSRVDIEQQNKMPSTAVQYENETAAKIWQLCVPATLSEPYIQCKQGKSDGLRVYPADAPYYEVCGKSVEGFLVVPCYSEDKIQTLQFIPRDGSQKLNLPGAKFNDGFFAVGEIKNRIYICEGIGQAWAVNEAIGEAAIVCFGAHRIRKVTQVLRKKYPIAQLIIVPDRGKEDDAVEIASITSSRWVELPLDKPSNYDVNDYLQEFGASLLKNLLENTKEPENKIQEESHDNKQSQSSTLVKFVEQRVELFHDKNSDTYARDIATQEARRLDGKSFKNWLVAKFYESTGKSVRDQSLREAMTTLNGIARHKGECHDVYIRVAQYEDVYYIDLGENDQSRAISITAGNWQIINNPPVRFIRPETLRPLPEPTRGPDISKLWSIINIPENSRLLVITWLIDCLRPDTPFPILELIGEQGSAKSTTQSMLRQLIDPNGCNLRGAPKTTDDIFVSAGINWLVSYENISHLAAPVQDALCILSTGGGHAKRKLYSDAEESVLVVKRPIVLNGISAAITAQDLIDRTISVETPEIQHRVEMTELWRIFETEYSNLFGALLTIFSQSLACLPEMKLPENNRTRLAEFARFGMAVANVMGKSTEEFLKEFNKSREESIVRTIDASPVASALIELFETENKRTITMPIKDLFVKVEQKRPLGVDSWPRTAKGFADALRRVAPALRQLGIGCKSLGKRGSYIWWEIKSCSY
ncbi:MAG: PriCT-2 domain-containing protein [Pseudomonadota bacterium]